MIRFKTLSAHPLVRDFMAAKLAHMELASDEGYLQVAGGEKTDEMGVIYPLAWEPRGSVLQLDLVEDGRRISTVLKHDGWWQGFVYDINDEAQYLCLGQSRADAVIKCALLQEFGDELNLSEADWELLAPALEQDAELDVQGENILERARRAALQGVLLPMQAWEIVDLHNSSGVHAEPRPITIERLGAGQGAAGAARIWAFGKDAAGEDMRLELRHVYFTREMAQQEIEREAPAPDEEPSVERPSARA